MKATDEINDILIVGDVRRGNVRRGYLCVQSIPFRKKWSGEIFNYHSKIFKNILYFVYNNIDGKKMSMAVMIFCEYIWCFGIVVS